MRTLRFIQCTDSRWDDDIKGLILQRIAKLEELFAPLDGVTFSHTEPRFLDWSTVPNSCNNQQYRVTCYVTKNTRKITWNDIYDLINSVKATYYEFI